MAPSSDILIIEDDIAIVGFMVEALHDEGYLVRSAYDGEQGLSQIRTTPPAVILLDMHMPGISTTEFLDSLHALGFPTIPIVIMTADTSAEEILATQCNLTYLFKPFDLDALLECVAQFVHP